MSEPFVVGDDELEERRQRRSSERRRLWDRRGRDERRSSGDRRRQERREHVDAVVRERRAGMERREGERREVPDRRVAAGRRMSRRRRATPTPFSAAELDALKAAFARGGLVECPACGSAFSLGESKRKGEQVARRVTCLGCSRTAVVPHTAAARVIVVDHLGERRDALRTVLTRAGHEVVETDDAAVALRAYRTVPADVVLLNVLAAGRMDAGLFMHRLRRDFPDARVVAVAGRSSQTGRDPLALAQGLGAAAVLRIPASADDVLRVLDEARRQ